jgi:hypothetical protein
MSAPTRNEQDLSRREEMSISSAAISGAPWGAAAATGTVVAVGDLGLHIIGTSLGLGALSGSLALGAVAFFVVAAAGALWRAKPGRAIRWARSNPWRFAVVPTVACAAIVLVLSVVTGGGVFPAVLSGLWHGGIVYGLTGAAGAVSKSRKSASLGLGRVRATRRHSPADPVASAMPLSRSACVTAPKTRSTMRCLASRKNVCGRPPTP